MKKRVLSLILTVLMMLSLFSVFSINAVAATFDFSYKPSVYFGGGGEYNIVWKTTEKSIGYVTYKYGGRTYTVYDEENGVVRSDDYIHTVRVPQSHLDSAGLYEVYSVAVNSRTDYNFSLGTSISVSSNFTGYHNQSEIKFGFFSDTHLMPHNKKTMEASKIHLTNYMGGVDVIVLNGDIPNNLPTEADFDLILDIGYTLSEGSIPVLYAKGNHECRGYYAQYLIKYLSYNTGEFYCQWDYGPVSGITIDVGEDKEDSHEEYYGVDDMDHYFEEQYLWLQNMGGYTRGSQYHISIGHSPYLIDQYLTKQYAQQMVNYGTDILVAGHSHAHKYVGEGEGNNELGFPVVHDGGHTDNETMRTTLLTMSNGNYSFKGFTETGSTAFEKTLETGRVGSSPVTAEIPENTVSVPQEELTEEAVEEETTDIEKEETVAVPTAAGVSTMELKGASETTSITVKPVVFDSGIYYSVVWQTSNESAGYVEITKGGQQYSYMDSVAGKLRTGITHSVKIPKEIFDNCNYNVRSRVVTNYAEYGLKSNPPTSYGPYTNGVITKFSNDTSSSLKKYTIAVVANNAVSNIDAVKVKTAIGANPSLIVSLGNMTSSFQSESNFGKYLEYMNTISSGMVPVIFLRGEGEATGEFASHIGGYIRNVTEALVMNKMYMNMTWGDLSIVGLDTATESADNDAKYKGYAAFDKIRSEQLTWMQDKIYSSSKGTYNIVFAHGDNLDNYLGVDFTKNFGGLGTNLVVTAGSGDATFKDGGTSYASATCGDTYGLLLTCQNDEITVEALGESKTEIGVVDVNVSIADNDDNDNVDDNKPSGDDDNDNVDDNEPSGDDENGDNVNDNNDGTTDNNYGGTTDGDNNNGSGQTIYEPGDFDGIDGDMYIRTVPDGWYNDYLGLGFSYSVVTSVSANGTMTEGIFIEIVSNLVGINYSMFDASTKADKASAWAESNGIYSGYLGGDNVLTDSVINTVISGLFAA